MISLTQLIVVVVVILAGATVFSTVGFGIGVTTIPILLLLIDPQAVVVVVNTVSVALFLLVIFQTRRHLPIREMLPVSIAGLLGVPVGVYLLGSVNASLLRVSIAALIIVLTMVAAFNVRGPMPKSGLVLLIVGFVTGVMLTALGVGGPLMALALLARDLPRHAIRGALSFYFLIVEGVGVVGYGVTGLFTLERAVLVLVMATPVLLGFGLATVIVRCMNEQVFRRAVIAVIIFTSLMVLGKELLTL